MRAVVVSPNIFGMKSVAEWKGERKGFGLFAKMAIPLFADTCILSGYDPYLGQQYLFFTA